MAKKEVTKQTQQTPASTINKPPTPTTTTGPASQDFGKGVCPAGAKEPSPYGDGK
jgi:hypothetical protein